MPTLILCADSCCSKKDKCHRFTANPLAEIHVNRKTRIEATLKHPEEEVCSKYRASTIIKITTER